MRPKQKNSRFCISFLFWESKHRDDTKTREREDIGISVIAITIVSFRPCQNGSSCLAI